MTLKKLNTQEFSMRKSSAKFFFFKKKVIYGNELFPKVNIFTFKIKVNSDFRKSIHEEFKYHIFSQKYILIDNLKKKKNLCFLTYDLLIFLE